MDPQTGFCARTNRRCSLANAWALLFSDARLVCQRRHLAGADVEFITDNLVFVFEQSPFRRSGRASAVRVVGTAMAGAHEKLRLGEPANRTAKVGTVDREDLKCGSTYSAHPARRLRGLTVLGMSRRTLEFSESRLPLWELIETPKRDPGVIGSLLLDRSSRWSDQRWLSPDRRPLNVARANCGSRSICALCLVDSAISIETPANPS